MPPVSRTKLRRVMVSVLAAYTVGRAATDWVPLPDDARFLLRMLAAALIARVMYLLLTEEG